MTGLHLPDLLNELEARELPLLSWGITNGSFSEGELLNLLEALRPSEDPEDLLEQLIDAGLLVERGLTGDRFRTRMAETVRLASSLRQWFHGRDWQTAPSLVSDLRFLSRARVVPDRDVSAEVLEKQLREQLQDRWTDSHASVVGSILNGRQVSRFQARATERLLSVVENRGGTCITAGTGAGKTLAFYLPALAHILATPAPPGVPRIVAIYPRVELLRDQLRGILEVVQQLHGTDSGSLRVGALYGATPHDKGDAQRNRQRGWRSVGEGLVSPFLRCLESECDGEYLWPESDRDGRLLRCRVCKSELDSLVFTRQALQSRAPEILFTTTEMVNRLLGSARMRKLLVGSTSHSPDFILLDEIHTYSGTHGAQVANLIRRWRTEMSAPSHVVGLSATLSDPIGFFSQLIGAESGNVDVVSPADNEMRESGREYFMLLRGDPASQTSLLSTTIQTAMLLRRMLDPEPGHPSSGAFGSRVFAFTDNLDVVNRLHSQLQDAEGWQPGGVNRKPNGSLATLRRRGIDDLARDDQGQLWDVSEDLGTLHRTVRVERTTSQDTGVGSDSDIVVATASLEVGFDDPNVGAVIQHKAPRDAAQFLQRRGRAGRDPTMRPWTTVVLSDYGRDRLAFQAYETLFDPRVQPQHLPIKNRVILKMQATWWLLDYLSKLTGGVPARTLLSSPWTKNRDRQRSQADRALAEIRSLLSDAGINKLHGALKRALRLSDEEARAILWDHPRALATTVLPTIVRRLEAVAEIARVPTDFYWTDPVDDFVPSSLFAPLQTPEVRVLMPPVGERDPEYHAQPIAQTMWEFAPGRVSYRFALRGKRERMWVVPPASDSSQLRLDGFCSDYLELEPPPGVDLRVVQPRVLELSRPAQRVPDSAYGHWNWEVAFFHDGEPLALDIPAGSPWVGQVLAVRAMTHRSRAPLTVWRYARSVEVERRVPTEPTCTRHRITLDEQDVAVGFAMNVDGFRVDVALPPAIPPCEGTNLERALRSAYFEHLMMTDPTLVAETSSSFLRNWLSQLALSVVATSGSRGSEVPLHSIAGEELRSSMIEAARIVFGSMATTTDDRNHNYEDPGLVADVEAELCKDEVLSAIQNCLTTLNGPLPSDSLSWLQQRFAATVAASLVEAIQATCPDLDVNDLRSDIEVSVEGDSQPVAQITISEDQPGGTGVIEEAIDRIIEDPRSFWAVVSSAFGACDGERVDTNLRSFLDLRKRGTFQQEVGQVRSASNLAETTLAWTELRKSLFRQGIDADQTVISALATRLLRPGSDVGTEDLCRDLLDRWDQLEAELGLEVELRVFAFLAATDPDVRQQLDVISVNTNQADDWAVGQLVGLLWPRGGKLRSSSLQSYNPYSDLPRTERLLLERIVSAPTLTVDSSEPEWREDLDGHLRDAGTATVVSANESDASSVVRGLLTQPTAFGVLEFHPRVVGLSRPAGAIHLLVDVREAQQ